MTRLTIRIDLSPDAAFGPGKARLLELIAEKSSIRGAAAAMDMSYRRAWLLLKEIDRIIGGPATVTRTGGTKGGGTVLSAPGRAVLKHYRAIEARAARAASAELRAVSMLAAGKRLRRKPTGRTS